MGTQRFTILLEIKDKSMVHEKQIKNSWQPRKLGDFLERQDDSHWEEEIHYRLIKRVVGIYREIKLETSGLLIQRHLTLAAIRYCH